MNSNNSIFNTDMSASAAEVKPPVPTAIISFINALKLFITPLNTANRYHPLVHHAMMTWDTQEIYLSIQQKF